MNESTKTQRIIMTVVAVLGGIYLLAIAPTQAMQTLKINNSFLKIKTICKITMPTIKIKANILDNLNLKIKLLECLLLHRSSLTNLSNNHSNISNNHKINTW